MTNQNDIEEHTTTLSVFKKEGLTKKDITKLFKNRHGNTPVRINGKRSLSAYWRDGAIHINTNLR
ncbi:MAG: hypothetical protein GWP06_06085 [Actinobacteria bacterium]|nr:hypothetical protein [Actinomycetota bacterium]